MERKHIVNCKIFQQFFVDFIDGEIDPALQENLEEHMKTCGFCRNLYHGISRVSSILKRVQSIKTSPMFQPNLYHRIHQEFLSSEKPLYKLKEYIFGQKRILYFSPIIAAILLIAVFLWAPNTRIMKTPVLKPNQINSRPIELETISPTVEVIYYIMEKQPKENQDNSEFVRLAQSFPDIILVSDRHGSGKHHITF